MSGFYTGWRVVAGAHVGAAAAFGTQYSFAAFFPALGQEFGSGRAGISLAFSLAGLLVYLVGAFAGMAADRFGPRPLAVLAGVALAGGLALAGQAPTLPFVYLGFGIGVGLGAGCFYVPAMGAVQRWFGRRRGLASGVAVAGIGIGTLLIPPLTAVLIEHLGWRAAIGWIGLGGGVALLLAAWLILPSPAAAGVVHEDGVAPVGAVVGLSLAQALASRPFWLLWVATAIACTGIMVPFVHLAPYAADLGLSTRFGALLVGLIGAGSIAGRFLMGGIADRFGRRQIIAISLIGQSVLLVLWLLSASEVPLVAFAVLYGVFYGGYVAMSPPLIMDFFGARSVSGVIGLLYTSVGVGSFAGPSLAGLAYDLSGSYTLPIACAAGCTGLAAFLILALAEPRRWSLAHAANQPA